MVGALAGSLLGGGKKQDHSQQGYSGQQHGSGGAGGLMGSIGGMFGGSGAGHHGSTVCYTPLHFIEPGVD